MKPVVVIAIALVILLVCGQIYAAPGIEDELKNVVRFRIMRLNQFILDSKFLQTVQSE